MDISKKILVVDDTDEIRAYLREMLQIAGFAVYDCADGRSALDAARENEFQVIIIDYHMPNMNGADVTRLLRPRFPASFIIGASSDDKQKDFLTAGADAFLKKPCRSGDIIKLLHENNILTPGPPP